MIVTPGSNDPVGHETVPTVLSLTAGLVTVTFPMFFTKNTYAIVEPAVAPVGVPACLSNEIAGDRVTGETTELVTVTTEPDGDVPAAVAVLFTVPASTSACVNAYTFVHVIDAAGASVPTGQLTGPTFGSLTPTLVNVTLPVFFTTNEYPIVEPADIPDGAPADFVNVIAGDRVTGVTTELVAVTAAPVGGFPDAVAVLFTVPASTSAWVRT